VIVIYLLNKYHSRKSVIWPRWDQGVFGCVHSSRIPPWVCVRSTLRKKWETQSWPYCNKSLAQFRYDSSTTFWE